MYKSSLSFFFLYLMIFAYPAFAQNTDNKKVQFYKTDKVQETFENNLPSDMHEKLTIITGEWAYKATFWATPDAEPDMTEGVIMNDMVLGERYLSMHATGLASLNYHYDPYEGLGYIGYDAIRGLYTSVWMDSLNTGMMTSTGTYREEDNVIEFTGQYVSPAQKKEQSFRAELYLLTSPDEYKFVQYTNDKSNKEFKTMEIEYVRKP